MSASRIPVCFPWLALCIGIAGWLGAAHAASLPDFVDLVEANAPAVVNISTSQKVQASHHRLPPGLEMPDLPEDTPFGDLLRRFFGEGDGHGELEDFDSKSLGSGLIMSADGYILTNHHVVRDADEIIVRLSDRREFVAAIVGADKRSDVALLKIDADDLPTVKIGSSKDLKVGEWVLAIGSPFGFDHTVTAGIVSAKKRNLPSENYVPFIQTDVAINPGNSGGPLFNLDGEVVGVNSQIYSRTGGFMGLSFAIPIDVAMDVAQQLKESGRVSRGWLGVLIQDVTRELAASFGMKKPSGALVAKVLPDSPAAEAGIEVGDIITRFDGQEVTNSSALPPLVGATPFDTVIPLEILRKGNTRSIDLRIGELPSEEDLAIAKPRPVTVPENRLGLLVSELTDDQRSAEGVEEGGVWVREVHEGAAQRAGIRAGDIVLMVDNEPVRDVGHFEEMVADLPTDSTVAVLVQRSTGPLFLAMRVPGE